MLFPVSSWMIQDGLLPELRAGDVVRLVPTLRPAGAFTASATGAPACLPLGRDACRLTGRVVWSGPTGTVLDCGIRALLLGAEPVAPPPDSWLSGRFLTGIDPARLLPDHPCRDDAPGRDPRSRVASWWRIDRILLDTTPWIETHRPPEGWLGRCPLDLPAAAGLPDPAVVLVPDPARRSEMEIPRTQALGPAEGSASYFIDCSPAAPPA